MHFKVILLLGLVILISITEVPAQFLLDTTTHQDECKMDSDCAPTAAGGQCCMKVRDPNDGGRYLKCMPLGVEGSVCDLDGGRRGWDGVELDIPTEMNKLCQKTSAHQSIYGVVLRDKVLKFEATDMLHLVIWLKSYTFSFI
ncbi:hypothetical protein PoB_006342400 [Plakobranchus ocellatus]|uniref:Prokineticin domain-containing protein n=1 Tax=Plakobranchus ocellatus TaxID=259542 RepID=A0AAV4CYK5_9GAST|nr:hypothetical protein PoB_006342400 [Plakobranchus ocellatus]